MKIGENPPVSEDRKKYTDNEEKLAALKAKPVEDLSMEEFQALKSLKKENTDLVGKAQEEATAEDAERSMYDEAKAEDAERKVYDEAKAEDVVRTETKLAEEKLRFAQEATAQAEADAKAYAEKLATLQGTKTETGQPDGTGESPEQTSIEAEKGNRAKHLLGELFKKGETFNPFMGRIPKEIAAMGEELEEKIEGLNQAKLAEDFFEETIGQNISNIPKAYSVYGLLKGTEFSKRFKELESARLKKAGYSELTL